MIKRDELLFVVDQDNSPLEPKTRREVHETGLWHRTAVVWVINASNEVLCQKRSQLKDTSKGIWEPYFGGHLAPNISYVDGAYIELSEELGLKLRKDKFILYKEYRNEKAKEFQGVFGVNWSGNVEKLKLEKEEVEEVKWMYIYQVKLLMLVERDKSWTEMAYSNDILEWLLTL